MGPEGDGAQRERVEITALASMENAITATSAEDIGKWTAELVFDAESPINTPVYVAGETLTYEQLADILERVLKPNGVEVVRKVWTVEWLKGEMERGEGERDKLKRYRVVFAEGRGVSWPRGGCWGVGRGWV